MGKRTSVSRIDQREQSGRAWLFKDSRNSQKAGDWGCGGLRAGEEWAGREERGVGRWRGGVVGWRERGE